MGLTDSTPMALRRLVNRARAGTSRARVLRKAKILRHYGGSLRTAEGRRYVLFDPELDNFTYDLANEGDLARTIATALGRSEAEIAGYFAEVHADPLLHTLPRRPLSQKREPHYARRLGWYAIARALHPGVVVETGVHSGLGSVLLLRALERNGSGRLLSFDTNPHAGWLVPDALRADWTFVVGPTTSTLAPALEGNEVGMVIHDSDHSYECERYEYETVLEHAAPEVALVSDNAHVTSALADVCGARDVQSLVFREEPWGHFYPGAALGVGLVRPAARP